MSYGMHYDLPMPGIHTLAAEMKERPTPEVEGRIRAVAAGGGDPYRVHAEVQLDYPSVTISQVAWVLTN